MPAAAAIPAIAAVAGGAMQASGARSAANASAAGSAASAAQQMQMYNQTRADQMPWLQTGAQALNMLGGVYGFTPSAIPGSVSSVQASGGGGSTSGSSGGGFDIFNPLGTHSRGGIGGALTLDPLGLFGGGGHQSVRTDQSPAGAMQVDGIPGNYAAWQANGSPANYDPATGMQIAAPASTTTQQPTGGYLQNAPNYDNFFKSPDYNFRLNEGIKGLDRSAAARGRLYSGGYGQDLTDYSQGLAAGEYGNWFNRLSSLAGVGQSAAQNVGNAGVQTGQGVGQAYQNAGNARASGYANQANAWGNALGGVTSAIGYGMGANGWGR